MEIFDFDQWKNTQYAEIDIIKLIVLEFTKMLLWFVCSEIRAFSREGCSKSNLHLVVNTRRFSEIFRVLSIVYAMTSV